MHQRWPFFQSTLQLQEMVLAKADPTIFAEYDRRLGEDALGQALLVRLQRTRAAVERVIGRPLLSDNPVLRRSIDVRNPYVDPINLAQVHLLRRLRERPDDPELRQAFALTVNGVAAGMRNTG